MLKSYKNEQNLFDVAGLFFINVRIGKSKINDRCFEKIFKILIDS